MVYDVIILGGGPAGLSAGIYAGRARLTTLIIEMERDGGQIAETNRVENYPGQIPGGETGEELVARMTQQCADFGCERAQDTIQEVVFGDGQVHQLVGQRDTYEAKTVIIATGASPKPTGVKNEDKFRGMGVSYCATCDANFFKGLDIYVVGGDNSAAGGAVYLSKFGKHVYMVIRGEELTASETMKDRVAENDNITLIKNSVVAELGGKMDLSEITVKDVHTGELTTYQADEKDGMFGVFFMGTRPNTDLFAGTALQIDDKGYIPTDEEMQTNIPGVYAAGDVRVKSLRQVVTAAADGAIAAVNAGKYVRRK